MCQGILISILAETALRVRCDGDPSLAEGLESHRESGRGDDLN